MSGLVFYDDWAGADNSAWNSLKWIEKISNTGASTFISGNMGVMQKAAGPSSSLIGMQTTNPALADCEIYCDFYTANLNGKAASISFRSDGTYGFLSLPKNCYTLNIQVGYEPFNGLFKRSNDVTTLVQQANSNLAAGDTLHIRIRAVGPQIQVRMWRNSETEPSTWNVDYTDGSPRPSGFVAVGFSYSGTGGDSVAFDNISVTDLNMPTQNNPAKVRQSGSWVTGSMKYRGSGTWQ